MGKALLGFVVGVALTCLAFALLGSARKSTGSPSVDAGTTGQDVLTIPAGNGRSDDSVLSAAAESQVEEAVPSTQDRVESVPSAQELVVSVSDNLSGEVDISRLTEQLLEASVRSGTENLMDTILAARPVVLPSPLPPEFDWLSENAYANFFHESFQREVRDEPWASAAESELLTHIFGEFERLQRYGYPTVECHTTRCIVKFVGYGVDEDPSVASRVLRDATREYQESSELVGCVNKPLEVCALAAHSEGGVTTIYWGIRRNQN